MTKFGSGNQRTSISALDICGRATVAVLQNPQAFFNRPAYFADWTVSTNEILAMLESITTEDEMKWSVEEVPLDVLFAEGMRLWEEDDMEGVKDRLATKAYAMLSTYGVFDEGNRYGADFERKVENGFGREKQELKADLEKIVREYQER